MKKLIRCFVLGMLAVTIVGCGQTKAKKNSVKTDSASLQENKVQRMSQVEQEVYIKFKDQQKNDKNLKIVKPTDEEVKEIGNTEIGIGIPTMAYVDKKTVILYDAQHIYAYSFAKRRLQWMCDISSIGFSALEGDEAYVLNVNQDGTRLYLSYAFLTDENCYAVIDVATGAVKRTMGESYTDFYQPKIDQEQENPYSDVYIDEQESRVWVQLDQKGNKNRNVQIIVSNGQKQEVYTPFVA